MPEAGRWAGAGHAREADPAAAAARAVLAAVRGRTDPRLLVAFAAPRYPLDALAAALHAAAPGVPLVGCTTAGELTDGGAHDDSLVVAALGGPGFQVCTAAVPRAGDDLRAAGVEAAAALGDVADRPHRALLLLCDGLAGDGQEVVRGAYSVAGAGVPLIGACAASGATGHPTGQLHGATALRGALVAAAIGSDAPFGIGVRHGWGSVGDPLHVTRTDGPAIVALDDRPALDVYLERLGVPLAEREDPEAFARFAHACPLGLRHKGEERVRIVVGADHRRRTLRLAAAVPQGGLAWLMRDDRGAVARAGSAACADALAGIGGAPPLALLAFGSAARRTVDGEPAVVREHAGGAPVAGFYGLGEIARARGVNGFHNHALAVLAVA